MRNLFTIIVCLLCAPAVAAESVIPPMPEQPPPRAMHQNATNLPTPNSDDYLAALQVALQMALRREAEDQKLILELNARLSAASRRIAADEAAP